MMGIPGSYLPENPEAIEPAKENLTHKDGQHNVIYGREQLVVFLWKKEEDRKRARGIREQDLSQAGERGGVCWGDGTLVSFRETFYTYARQCQVHSCHVTVDTVLKSSFLFCGILQTGN